MNYLIFLEKRASPGSRDLNIFEHQVLMIPKWLSCGLQTWHVCLLRWFMDVSPLRQFAPGHFAPKTFRPWCLGFNWISRIITIICWRRGETSSYHRDHTCWLHEGNGGNRPMAKKIWWQCPQVTPHELYKAKIYSKKRRLRTILFYIHCKKLEFKAVSVDGLGSGMGKW